MKFFKSEFAHSYSSYSFGYCNYVTRERGDSLAPIYAAGYLPYSATKGVSDVFYMARSVRLSLKNWNLNSENRRIHKRFLGLKKQVFPVKQFHVTQQFLDFCSCYFVKKHGRGIMPRARLKHVIDSFVTDIIEYRIGGELAGYVFLSGDKDISHFFYSFYDLKYANQSLGMRLMIDVALSARQGGKKFLYLGTAYGEKGLYKTNFDELEYWDGSSWIQDKAMLRKLCRSDGERVVDLIDEQKVLWGSGWRAAS